MVQSNKQVHVNSSKLFTHTKQPLLTSASREDIMQALPMWFRECVDDIYKKKHGTNCGAALSTGNTTMAALGCISLPHILAGKRSSCKLVHLSKTEICMCTKSMLEVPFQVFFSVGVKRRQ